MLRTSLYHLGNARRANRFSSEDALKGFVMQINRVVQETDWVELKSEGGLLRLEPLSNQIIHIRYTNQAAFSQVTSLMVIPEQPRQWAAPAQPLRWKLEDQVDMLALTTPDLRLDVDKKTGAFTWSDAKGNLLVREPARGGKHLQAIDLGERKAVSTRLELCFSVGEAIYGLGQHEEAIFNYRGHSQFLYQHNLKVAMPVLVSTHGYAILFDSYSLSSFHDDQYGSYFWSEVEDEMDFYFLYGPEFDDLVGGIRWLTGQPTLLPRWAYGYLQSKERYRRQTELVDVVQEYRRRGIGLDAIVLDWMSWQGNLWGQKTLDPDRFPDPDKMMRDLHAANAKLMVSMWPRFRNDGPDQVELRQEGLLLADDATYNAFDPRGRALYWKQANNGLFKHGIDAWWCDCSEPWDPDWQGGPVKLEPWQRMLTNLEIFKRCLDPERINAYSLLHAQGIYKGQRSVTEEKRVVNLTRSAYPGQVRYGTVTWSGDISARWETLKQQIPAGLNFTVTGSPRWTFDIGGFFVDNRQETLPDGRPGHWYWNGAYPDGCDDRAYRELYTRWFQVGAFLPMFRAHGTDTPREVWRFGKPGELVYETLVKFIRLRYRLLPYIYSAAAWETFRAYTMLRALAFDFRHDPLVYEIADQFMFGPALMVCPVLEPMYFRTDQEPIENQAKERTVYLPSGTDWYNFWNGKRYAGGQLIRTPAPLDILPLFVRAGSVLPLGPEIEYASQRPGAPIELRIYPGRDGRFDLYEDEGDSYRYEQGEYAWTPLVWADGTRTLSAGPRSGIYRGMPANRVFNLVIGGAGIEPGIPAAQLTLTGRERPAVQLPR